MTHRLRFYLMVGVLALSLPSYLMLMALSGDGNFFLRIARLPGGLPVVLCLLAVFAWGVSAVLDVLVILKRTIFKPKLGEVLVAEGYITQEELNQALGEQRQRLGEILVKTGRVTAEQLDLALERQKQDPRRIGEILREMAYATDEDVDWALTRMKRRIGKVLLERGLLTEYDVGWGLSEQRNPRRQQAVT